MMRITNVIAAITDKIYYTYDIKTTNKAIINGPQEQLFTIFFKSCPF